MSYQELVDEVKKLRRTAYYLMGGYAAFWTLLIIGTVVLYTHHLIP